MLKNIKKRLKNQRGLTLVELLAVIVILGIISAIAVPSIGKIITNSENDAKVAEALQIINAAKLDHASNSKTTVWVHTGATGTQAELSDYLTNVNDKTYTVNYDATNKKYTITGHESASVLNKKDTDTIDESELINHAK